MIDLNYLILISDKSHTYMYINEFQLKSFSNINLPYTLILNKYLPLLHAHAHPFRILTIITQCNKDIVDKFAFCNGQRAPFLFAEYGQVITF